MREEIESTIRTDAAADAAFRDALAIDAGLAIAERYGVAIPDALTVRVIQEQSDEVILVLPALQSTVLDEVDLESVTGGTAYTIDPCGKI